MFDADMKGGNGTFVRQTAMLWRGSTVMGTPTAIKMIAWDKADSDGTVRIYDVTNSQVICSVAVTVNSYTIVDFGKEAGCDGMTVDERGNVYLTARSARRPGVMVVDGRGNERAFIPTGPPNQTAGDPSRPLVGLPSNVEFGIGDERNVLYVTVDVSLYRIRLEVKGYHAQSAGRD